MEILVVGGLGYLGSILVDLLSNDKHKVDICDICLYDNENVKENIKFRSLAMKNIKDYDCVVWCANNDLGLFHADEKLRNYNLFQFGLFKDCVANSKRFINCSTYQLNYKSNLDSEVGKHFLALEKCVNDIDKYPISTHINIRIPSLYGPSPRMRWDTFANSVILSLLINNEVIIDKDWKTKIPLSHVVDMALYIKDLITKDETNIVKNFSTDIMNLVEISHELAFLMKSKDRYKVEVINDGGCIMLDEYAATDWLPHREEFFSLKDSLIDFKKNLEAGNLPNFLDDKYNNEVWIDNALKSHHFWKTIGV